MKGYECPTTIAEDDLEDEFVRWTEQAETVALYGAAVTDLGYGHWCIENRHLFDEMMQDRYDSYF